MRKPTREPVVASYRLTAGMAEKRIRGLALETENIRWGIHALDRMTERGIFDVLVLRVVRNGSCPENPVLTERGEWKAKMVCRVAGARDVGVVVVILKANKLFIKTVEWEDLK